MSCPEVCIPVLQIAAAFSAADADANGSISMEVGLPKADACYSKRLPGAAPALNELPAAHSHAICATLEEFEHLFGANTASDQQMLQSAFDAVDKNKVSCEWMQILSMQQIIMARLLKNMFRTFWDGIRVEGQDPWEVPGSHPPGSQFLLTPQNNV